MPAPPVAAAAPVLESEHPSSQPDWPIPRFSLRIDDLAHPGTAIFLQHIDVLDALREAVIASCHWLYTEETVPRA
jgi:hypothetical protein